MGLLSIFKKRKPNYRSSSGGKESAVAFVDFEHWYISLDKSHGHARPDIKGWRDELSAKFDIKEIIFFGDFSNLSLKYEIPKIRQITNYIIETQNTSGKVKKDFTDFIMLDHIYQKAALYPEIDCFILFSGDGHFNSVANYLTTQLGKRVGVYGIKGCVSRQLSETASFVELLPREVDPMLDKYLMVLSSLKRLEEKSKGKKKLYATFWGTTEAVSRRNHMKRSAAGEILRAMIEKGYIVQSELPIDGKTIKVIRVDWGKCKANGIVLP